MSTQPVLSDVPADRSAARVAFAAAAHRRGVRTSAEYTTVACWYIGIWFWAIALLVGGIIAFVMLRTGTDVELSAVSGTAESGRFYLLVMGIILPLTLVALHLAAGGTRRSLAVGLCVSGVVIGVTFGLASAIFEWVAWWAFGRLGWGNESAQDQLYLDGSQFALVLLVQSIWCAVYFLVGAAIALGYYRAGFWRGTGLVLVALVPLAVAELSLQSGWFGRALSRVAGLPEASVWGAALGGLVAFALAALLVRVVLRDVAIRPVDFSASVKGG